MLNSKEIKYYKDKHGYKEFSFYLRYIEACSKWKYLPKAFILQALRESEVSPFDRNTATRINRKDKRQIQNQLVDSSIATYRPKQKGAS
jgi:hypothetical protein